MLNTQSLNKQRGVTAIGWLIILGLIAFFTLLVLRIAPMYLEFYSAESILENLLTFIYTLGHWLGEKIVELIQYISGIQLGQEIVDAIGMLVILTIFLGIAEVAKKAIWIVVAIGWILIFVRILMIMIG